MTNVEIKKKALRNAYPLQTTLFHIQIIIFRVFKHWFITVTWTKQFQIYEHKLM
jgi:hypothetical protein